MKMWRVFFRPFVAYLTVRSGLVATEYRDGVLWVDGHGLYVGETFVVSKRGQFLTVQIPSTSSIGDDFVSSKAISS